MKESYQYLFVLAIASIFTILGVVIQPLFSPLTLSNITWFNVQVVLSRFLVASPLIIFFIIATLLIIRQIKKIDNEKDDRLADKIANKFTDAFKKALKEDREESKQPVIVNIKGFHLTDKTKYRDETPEDK